MLGYLSLLVTLISYVTKYMPTIVKVVKKVEELSKYKQMTSAEKKQKALELLDEVLNFTSLPEDKQKDVINFVSGLIDAVVAVMNLKKSF